jgi:hypothetical protein
LISEESLGEIARPVDSLGFVTLSTFTLGARWAACAFVVLGAAFGSDSTLGSVITLGSGVRFESTAVLTEAEIPEADSSMAKENSESDGGTRKEPWHFGHFPRFPAWKSFTCNG